jgi:hypothetical protein
MKQRIGFIFLLVLLVVRAGAYSVSFPTAPAAGQPGTTAIAMGDNALVAWADGYSNVQYGVEVKPNWQVPAKGLGQAQGTASDIVCLGRGGQITLTFSQGISDGPGFDFAVFENAISDTFLELAFVEVSSDGIHFVRFPHFSDSPDPVHSFGTVYADTLYGYAGKYRGGYGTPFDLSELVAVSNSIATGGHGLTLDYEANFTANISHLDMADVQFVRVIDIVGDGSVLDAEGFNIYDPYPTLGSAGFDLDAIGVINQPEVSGTPQIVSFDAIPHQELGFQSLELLATADSGLPVSFSVESGPATNSGNRLWFTGTGVVEVVANQPGDAVFAPAAPVLRTFHIAEHIQHIFVEPIPNQPAGVTQISVGAYSSRGLPVFMEVHESPPFVSIGETNHVLTLSAEDGDVILRAFQPGDATTAPAEEVYMHFQIVDALSPNQPVLFADWLVTHSVPEPKIQPFEDAYGRPAVSIEFPLEPQVLMRSRILKSANLSLWTNAVPEMVEMTPTNLLVRLSAEQSNGYFRVEFEGQ